MKYLFGPVNSRRLGLSLGVDLVPFKTCSLNCVYCECGCTTALTADVAEYVPTAAVIAELDAYLAPGPGLDVITFSGSGEPTLHSGLGRIIRHIREAYPSYRTAVLTNGTLFWREDVRRAVLDAHVLVPSLDAAGEEAFASINRPAPGITAARVVDGLAVLAREFTGELIVEVFLVPGINDGAEELARIRDACGRIRPARIQINALDRPGTEPWVRPASREDLERAAAFFAGFTVEIVARRALRDVQAGGAASGDLAKRLLATLERRPSTLDDLERTLGAAPTEIRAALDGLVRDGALDCKGMGGEEYYIVPK
ncbi:MAG: radical SAM protein [Spirochaetes bacterium]|nr:MAG: radical SAM protein [Spirochaetota bacterium]